jgi:UDP-N-acetylmuramoyl-tripeptide--D-alanyl-D-alanine ligase
MNHAGEIRALNAFVRPHVALITTIAPAHLEYFGTLEAIADAKAEILEGLEPGGAAILPADNPQLDRLKTHAQASGVKRILTFGTRAGADARLISAQSEGEEQNIVVALGGDRMALSIGAAGTHIAMNAMAALLAARELGADIKRASHALGNFAALKGRGARFSAGGIDIIDESYNANPASMSAALGLLGQARPRAQGRRLAVLGDMLELGPDSARLHRAILKDIASAPADRVFLCGAQMAALWLDLPERSRGAYAETSAELAPELMRNLRAGDVVLVKGSFGSRMSVIIDALKSREAATA